MHCILSLRLCNLDSASLAVDWLELRTILNVKCGSFFVYLFLSALAKACLIRLRCAGIFYCFELSKFVCII